MESGNVRYFLSLFSGLDSLLGVWWLLLACLRHMVPWKSGVLGSRVRRSSQGITYPLSACYIYTFLVTSYTHLHG